MFQLNQNRIDSYRRYFPQIALFNVSFDNSVSVPSEEKDESWSEVI